KPKSTAPSLAVADGVMVPLAWFARLIGTSIPPSVKNGRSGASSCVQSGCRGDRPPTGDWVSGCVAPTPPGIGEEPPAALPSKAVALQSEVEETGHLRRATAELNPEGLGPVGAEADGRRIVVGDLLHDLPELLRLAVELLHQRPAPREP